MSTPIVPLFNTRAAWMLLGASLSISGLAISCSEPPVELVAGCNERCLAHQAGCVRDSQNCVELCERLTESQLACLEADGCSAETYSVCLSSEGKCSLPQSQQASAPCCLGWGIDACGAGLLCAAIEKRDQPSCYPERSRRDMTECSTDELCASASCDLSQRKCRSSLHSECEASIGCAPLPSGTVVCEQDPWVNYRTYRICLRSNQPVGAPCRYDKECASKDCTSGGYCANT